MARKRLHTRRRSSKRRSRSSFGSRRGFAFLPAGVLLTTGATAGGFIASNLVSNQLAQRVAMFAEGWGKIGAKALAATAGFMLLKRFAGPQIATGFAVGGLTSCALDVYNRFQAGTAGATGMAGLGDIGYPDGVPYSYTGMLPGMLAGDYEEDDEAMGQMDEEDLVSVGME